MFTKLLEKMQKVTEETTSDAISFLPSQLGVITPYLGSLDRKKDWRVHVKEIDDGWLAEVEGKHFTGKKEHWNDFNKLFGGKLKTGDNVYRAE
jgi:hypothetical protein